MERKSLTRYKNPALPVNVRIDDLMEKMTLEQKVAQLGGILAVGINDGDLNTALLKGIGQVSIVLVEASSPEALAREVEKIQKFLVEKTGLSIPAIIHTEALSGGLFAGAVNFPASIGLSATWDPEGVRGMGDIIRRQMLALGIRHALSPVMDIARDHRWGRIGETYGEDPTLASSMSVAFVKGLQGEDLNQGIAATGKHFLGYSSSEGALNMAVQSITERELREVYAKPFEAAINEAGLATVMNSYGAINGEPIISSSTVLNKLLRDEMGFEGVTVSDYSSIDRMVTAFRTADNMADAGIQALTAGMDMELPSVNAYGTGLCKAVEECRLDIAVVDRSVRRVLELKFKLGLFENPYPDIKSIEREFQKPEYEELSYRLAAESIVLLKNEGSILPLSKTVQRIAIIGPNADSLRNLFGGYTYPVVLEASEWLKSRRHEAGASEKNSFDLSGFFSCKQESPFIDSKIKDLYPNADTVLGGVRKKAPYAEVRYARGCGIMDTDSSGFNAAITAAAGSDIAVMVLGAKNGWGFSCSIGEGLDSTDTGLPGVQEELVRAVYNTGTPVIVVHMSARPLSSPWIVENIPAILEVWHPGQCGAKAIVDVLFGECNPGGKLPLTVPRSAGQTPIYYAHQNGSGYKGRGHFELNSDGYVNESYHPLFYFGHGLSYTDFSYSDLSILSGSIPADGRLEIRCTVTNMGSVSGDETVQIYISDRLASMIRPVKELAGFKRISLMPGESRKVGFSVEMSQLAFLDKDMQWIVEPGEMDVMIGSSSNDIRLQGSFTITGPLKKIDGKRSHYAKDI